MLKKLLYEPLLHFLILGGLLFFFYSLSEDSNNDENAIIITNERIEQLTSEWEDKSLSIISKDEKQKLIKQEIYENILYQEALKIGLGINDTDMKKHLVDKMAFILYDTYKLSSPSDDILEKFMSENSNDYREEERVHFTQNIMSLDIETLEKEYNLTLIEANNIFGRSFSEMLFQLEKDGKVHKLESDYGVHEIYIISKPIPKLKDFKLIKEKLSTDYLNIKREQKNKIIYEALKLEYSISIKEN